MRANSDVKLTIGKLSFCHHFSHVPWEPGYPGAKKTFYDRFGLFYISWQGRLKTYETECIFYPNSFTVSNLYRMFVGGCSLATVLAVSFCLINNKNFYRKNSTRGIKLFGADFLFYTEIRTLRDLAPMVQNRIKAERLFRHYYRSNPG